MIECDVIDAGLGNEGRFRDYLVERHYCRRYRDANGVDLVEVTRLFLQRKTWPSRMLGCRCVVFVGLCEGCGKWIVAR